MVANYQGLPDTWSDVSILPTADLGTVRYWQGVSSTPQNRHCTIPKLCAPVRIRAVVPPVHPIIDIFSRVRPTDCWLIIGLVVVPYRPLVLARIVVGQAPQVVGVGVKVSQLKGCVIVRHVQRSKTCRLGQSCKVYQAKKSSQRGLQLPDGYGRHARQIDAADSVVPKIRFSASDASAWASAPLSTAPGIVKNPWSTPS